MRRTLVVLAGVAVLALPFAPSAVAQVGTSSHDHEVGQVAPTPARGGTKHKVVRDYIQQWVLRSNPMHKCIFLEVTGKVKGTWQYMYGDDSSDKDSLEWTDMSLVNPAIHAQGWPMRGKGCDSTKHWKMRATMSQAWYQYSCDLEVNAEVGVAAPWSVGVSVSPSYKCGENRQGHHTTTSVFKAGPVHQYNSGIPITFESDFASVRAGGFGFVGVFDITGTSKGGSDDSFRKSINVTLNK